MLSQLQKRLGAGESEVRNYTPFYNGWTCWYVRDRKDELITIGWEPANPAAKRQVDMISIDSFHSNHSHDRKIAANVLGFWGSIQLGESRSTLKSQLKTLGTPVAEGGNVLLWNTREIEVQAIFKRGRLIKVWIYPQ